MRPGNNAPGKMGEVVGIEGLRYVGTGTPRTKNTGVHRRQPWIGSGTALRVGVDSSGGSLRREERQPARRGGWGKVEGGVRGPRPSARVVHYCWLAGRVAEQGGSKRKRVEGAARGTAR